MFTKKGVLRNFAKFTEKHLCLRPAKIKKKRLAQVFPVNFAKFPKTPFFTEHLRWLLLNPLLKMFLQFYKRFNIHLPEFDRLLVRHRGKPVIISNPFGPKSVLFI